MQITFNFSELWFIFCLGQPKSILKKALSRPLHFKLMKFSALIKDLYRNLRNFQWLPLKFKDFSSYKDISPLFLDSEAATREHASYPRSREQNLSLARLLSPAAPLTRGLPKCRRLNQSEEWTARWISHEQCSLLRRFVFCTEASKKREWLVTKRKGPWEGKGRGAKRCLASFLLPSILCKNIFIERERERPLGTKQWTVFTKHLTRRDLSSYYKYHVTGNACP